MGSHKELSVRLEEHVRLLGRMLYETNVYGSSANNAEPDQTPRFAGYALFAYRMYF